MTETGTNAGLRDIIKRFLKRTTLCDTEKCGETIAVPDHQLDDIRSSISDRFYNEEIEGEHKISRVALIICLVALIYALIVFFRMNESLGISLGATVLFYLSYYAFNLFLLNTGRYRLWMKYISSTLEVTAPTIVALIDTMHVSAEYALTSSPPYIYFLAITGTVLRFNRILCLYAGTLAAAESALLYCWASSLFVTDSAALLSSLSPIIYYQRSGYIFCAGLIAASICSTARQLVNSVGMNIGRSQYLQRMFGKFVSDEVVEKIEREGLSTSGELREVTILCSDVRGFTSFSEQKAPQEVVRFINALFEMQCEIIQRYGGRVDKFMGDGMLAIFGAPVSLENHALSAAAAALEIASIERVDLISSREPIRMGVALNTGHAVIGNIGSEGRMEYTAMGDAVNTAFRIEGLNGRFNTKLLISAGTCKALGAKAKTNKLPSVKVKGKEAVISIYELIGLNP